MLTEQFGMRLALLVNNPGNRRKATAMPATTTSAERCNQRVAASSKGAVIIMPWKHAEAFRTHFRGLGFECVLYLYPREARARLVLANLAPSQVRDLVDAYVTGPNAGADAKSVAQSWYSSCSGGPRP
jgi:hypothetical protein